MKDPNRIKRHRVGEVSSKYGLRPDLFEADVQAHAEEAQSLDDGTPNHPGTVAVPVCPPV